MGDLITNHKISVDVHSNAYINVGCFKQYNSIENFEISVFDNGKPLELSNGNIIKLKIRTPDGRKLVMDSSIKYEKCNADDKGIDVTKVTNENINTYKPYISNIKVGDYVRKASGSFMSIENNIIKIQYIPQSVFSNSGKASCEVVLNDTHGQIATMTFVLTVVESVYENISEEELNDLFTLTKVEQLENNMNTCLAAASEADDSKDRARDYASDAQVAAQDANASKTSAATSETNASTYAKSSKSYAVGGTDTRTNENTDNAKYYYNQIVECLKDKGAGHNNLVVNNSLSMGRGEGSDIGENSVALGNGVVASGECSHAEGCVTTASDNYSHAEGFCTTASGCGSHAEGFNTTAKGAYSYAAGFSSANYKEPEVTIAEYTTLGAWGGNYALAEGGCSHVEGADCLASGDTSHAEGECTSTQGEASHSEGSNTIALGDYSHIEGKSGSIASKKVAGLLSATDDDIITTWVGGDSNDDLFSLAKGEASHVEGFNCLALGDYSHAEGGMTLARELFSHAEGYMTEASGETSHAEGWGTDASGKSSHSEGELTRAEGDYSHAEGSRTTASGYYSHIEGMSTNIVTTDLLTAKNDDIISVWNINDTFGSHSFSFAKGKASHVEGYDCLALGKVSHAEGNKTIASGDYSHAEGHTTKSSYYSSHAEGMSTTSSSHGSHSEGFNTIASGYASHAEGYNTKSINYASHSCGKYNADMTTGGGSSNTTGTAFVIGNGTNPDTKSNAFSVQYDGTVKAKSTITGTVTADYAEYFEWKDENVNNEDRIGYFVTLDGDKIKIATNEDGYILGVVSGEPFVLGNSDCDAWNGMYLHDEFRRTIYEPAPKTVDVLDKDGIPTGEHQVVEGEYEGTRPKLNPNYDNTKPYISRKDRKEWSPIGMLGVLAVRHDGTANVNGYVTVNGNGIATACSKSDENSYRVIKENSENVVEIIFR